METSQNNDISIFNSVLEKYSNNSNQLQLGENLDFEFSKLGLSSEPEKEFLNMLLEMKNFLVTNDEYKIRMIVNEYWKKIMSSLDLVSNKKPLIIILFKVLFFVRAIRCQGNRSRTQFYVLFDFMINNYLEEVIAVLHLIPEYGSFSDFNYLIDNYIANSKIRDKLIDIMVLNLKSDLSRVFGKSFDTMNLNEIKNLSYQLNKNLKSKTNEEMIKFVSTLQPGNFSIISKWITRENKKYKSYRPFLINKLFGKQKDMNFGNMVLRYCLTLLGQVLMIPEQNFCKSTSRTWKDIRWDKNVPSKCLTKNLKAGFNNKDDDRIECAENLKRCILEEKIKGYQCDLNDLADKIWNDIAHIKHLSEIEKLAINVQWHKMMENVKKMVLENNDNKIEEGTSNPFQTIPIIDVSGSMSSCNVMHYAIGLGILASSLSNFKGKAITFSEKPEIFSFDPDANIFDTFELINEAGWGMSTNIDSTNKLVLNLMKEARSKGFNKNKNINILYLTDGQFNSMVVDKDGKKLDEERKYHFQKRTELLFHNEGFDVPLQIFWNLADRKVGFPAQGATTGVKLVSGFSQTVMMEVFTGNYKTVVDQKSGAKKVDINPLDSFIDSMSHDSLLPIEEALVKFWLDVKGEKVDN